MAWCRQMGAHHVIDHRKPLAEQLRGLDIGEVDAAINLADTDRYWDALGELVAPQGHVGLIVEPAGALRIGDPYKAKCIGIHWEMMFARARFRTADMGEQHRILGRAGSLVDAGELRSTLTEVLGPINATNLREAHRRLEVGPHHRQARPGRLVAWDLEPGAHRHRDGEQTLARSRHMADNALSVR